VTDVRVAIDAAAQRFLRVVEVQRLQPIESHEPAELLERRRVSLRRTQIVARREQMAGVQANADAPVAVHSGDDRRQLLECGAERRALARGVLQ